MKLEIVWVIFRKEFLDVLRDRRTLISMILLPILLFPLLIGGLGSIMTGQMDKLESRSSPIILLGGELAGGLTACLQQDEGLQVITTIEDSAVASQMLEEHVVQAVVFIPDAFDITSTSDTDDRGSNQINIWYDKSHTESALTMRKVRDDISAYRDSLAQQELQVRGLPDYIVKPFLIETDNRASESKMAGAMLGMLLPYIVILLTVVGSTYSAIDLTAGEKERGTMETLLVCPASRLELVIGKFLTTATVGSITAILAVISMTITFMGPGSIMTHELGPDTSLSIDPLAFGMVFLLLLPIAALFAAVLIAIAINARSYKEAQSYSYPVVLATIVPAIASMMPGVEISAKMALIPVISVSLILRDAFVGTYEPMLIMLSFCSSIVYAAFAIFIAVRIFQKESVLLRI